MRQFLQELDIDDCIRFLLMLQQISTKLVNQNNTNVLFYSSGDQSLKSVSLGLIQSDRGLCSFRRL